MSLKMFVDLANALEVSADELLIDSLDNITAVSCKIGLDWLTDCDSNERRILLEILKTAKEVLQTNRALLKTTGR